MIFGLFQKLTLHTLSCTVILNHINEIVLDVCLFGVFVVFSLQKCTKSYAKMLKDNNTERALTQV